MKVITMTAFRKEPGEVLREPMKHGRTVLITKSGKPAAKLVPVSDDVEILPDGVISGPVEIGFFEALCAIRKSNLYG